MVVNGVTHALKLVNWSANAVPNRALQSLLSFDNTFLDGLIMMQRKSKKGIYKSTPWGGTPREWQEVGTKLSYKDMLAAKVQSLAGKYPTETKVLKMNGADREFTIYKGSQGGSNEGYWAMLNGTDDLYYIKYGGDAQIRSEQLAGELYELGGIPSTQKTVVSYTVPPKDRWSNPIERIGVASKWMPINCLPDANDATIVREGFGLDCWLANWDGLKDGNVVMTAGNAARLDVGGSLCYRARGGRKGTAFGENVNELTSFFDSYSHSRPYIRNMSKDELIRSLDRVISIPDEKIIQTVERAAQYTQVPGGVNPKTGKYDFGLTHTVAKGVQNPEYLKEILIARKGYITRFRNTCLDTPQMSGETIEQYIRRVDADLAKVKYDLPFEKIEMSTEVTDGVKNISMAERLTPSQKRLYEESYKAYKSSSKNTIIRQSSGNVLGENSMLHATSYKNLEDILSKGITTGDARGAIGSGTGCATQTPLCADFWDVDGTYAIRDYFARPHYNPGEASFLPRTTPGGLSNTRSSVVLVVDKTRVAPTIMKNSFKISEGKSILYKDGNMAGHTNYVTHRAVPIGVPANAIEKMILRKEAYSPVAIQQIKDLIASKGLRIELYDLEGNLL